MDNMQFRNYVFPHNPAVISVSEENRVVSHFIAGRGEIQQRLGPQALQITCTGSFLGASWRDAAAQLEEFRAACVDGEAGVLFLPGLAPMRARLREFSWRAQGDGRVIPYTLCFVQAGWEE